MTELPPPVSGLADHVGLIYKAIHVLMNGRRRWRLRSVDKDDLVQSLFLTLIQTTKTFDPAVGTKWSGYAFSSLEFKARTLLWQIHYRNDRCRSPLGVKYVPMSDVSPSLVWGTDPRYARADSGLVGVDEAEETKFTTKKITELLASLKSTRDRQLVREFYGVGCARKSRKRLAAEFGITKQRVYQIVAHALKKMRKVMNSR